MELELLLSNSLVRPQIIGSKLLIFKDKLIIDIETIKNEYTITYRLSNQWLRWVRANLDPALPFEPLKHVHEFFKNEAILPFFLKDDTLKKFNTFSHYYFLNTTIKEEYF